MYTRREASQLRQEFWTSFCQYMQPLANADGEKINWVNYKTGNRFIQVKMDANEQSAVFSITINCPDESARQQYFNQFLAQKYFFEQETGRDWMWQPSTTDGFLKPVAIISKTLIGVSIFNKEHWPSLIVFFKQSIIAFDAFWQMARYGFEEM